MQTLAGRFAPLPTAFTDDGESLSEIRTARLVRKLCERESIGGLILGTDLGEFPMVGTADRKQHLETVLREAQGRKPVLAHISRLSTAGTLDLAQHAGRHGARAAVVMPPYYGTFTEAEVLSHLKTIAQYAGVPVIIVDPAGMVTSAVREALSLIGGVHFGTGRRNDEFRTEGIEVTPAALMGDDPNVCELFQKFHPAAVGKAYCEAIGIEQGSPRRPVQPLPRDAWAVIERAVG